MVPDKNKLSPEDRELQERFGTGAPATGLVEWFHSTAFVLWRWLDILLWEKRKWVALPWRQRLKAWRRGFSSQSWLVYGLADKDTRDYMPDAVQLRYGYEPNRPYNQLFSKAFLNAILEGLGARLPPYYGHLVRGRLYRASGSNTDAVSGLESLLDKGRKLVLKPSFGRGGRGILFVEKNDGHYEINHSKASPDEFRRLTTLLDDYVVTGFVQQGEYAELIFPGSSNTLRILTLWDYEAAEPFIAGSAHRFGRAGSSGTDNFQAGVQGLAANIDLATGRLGPAVMKQDGQYGCFSAHPETGQAIEGVVVPGWEIFTRELLEIAARLPATPLIAWDCLQTDDGWVVLEANTTPGYQVWQANTPVMRDPRARKFYQRHGMAP